VSRATVALIQGLVSFVIGSTSASDPNAEVRSTAAVCDKPTLRSQLDAKSRAFANAPASIAAGWRTEAISVCLRLFQLLHNLIDAEARRFLSRRIVFEGPNKLRHERLRRHNDE
jgi:hypothetical protein